MLTLKDRAPESVRWAQHSQKISSDNRLAEARAYLASGLSLVPIDHASKWPSIEWKVYQERLPTDDELSQWIRKYPGLGIVGGKISGNSTDNTGLEILDIESIAPIEDFRNQVDARAPALLSHLPQVKTPSGGYHIYYRCPRVEGNQKLSERAIPVSEENLPHKDDGSPDSDTIRREGLRNIEGKYFKIKTLIETRGEGGQVLSPLCLPTVYPGGGVYEVLQGDLTSIPTITLEEREVILSSARSCNEFIDLKRTRGRKEAGREQVNGVRPGEDFNSQADVSNQVAELLKTNGWSKFGEGRIGELWSRPGISDHCSATLFDDGTLYVFSTNANPFDGATAYSPFAIFAYLEHDGDFQAAARSLANKGYGDQRSRKSEPKRTIEYLKEQAAPMGDDGWPEPLPLPIGLKPVPSLPESLVPEPIRDWLTDITMRLQVPLEFPTIPAIVAISSVIGNQVSIRPKRRDDWTVIPNCWGAIVGRPGVLKTPAIAEALKPLYRLVKGAEQSHKEALSNWSFERERIDILKAAMRDKMKRAAKEGSDLEHFRDELVGEIVSEPTERRYMVNDTTVEKYGELLNSNPNGLLIFRDELTGWLRSLDEEQRAKDRAFYLEAWNGDGSFTYDRIGRGTLKIENTTTSIIGGIQPGPLETYLRGAIGYGERDDGLFQRFQLLVYPDLAQDFRYTDESPDEQAKDKAFKIFKNLSDISIVASGIKIDKHEKPFLRFDDDAQEFFAEWFSDLNKSLRQSDIHPALEAHFAKYRSLMPTLALIFELCAAAAKDFEGFEGLVSMNSAETAAAWCSFLEKHAQRVYGLGIGAAAIHAKTLARRLQEGDLEDGFTARKLYLKGWAGLNTSRSVELPLDLLIESKWLQPIQTEAGRTTTIYFINPRIKEVRL